MVAFQDTHRLWDLSRKPGHYALTAYTFFLYFGLSLTYSLADEVHNVCEFSLVLSPSSAGRGSCGPVHLRPGNVDFEVSNRRGIKSLNGTFCNSSTRPRVSSFLHPVSSAYSRTVLTVMFSKIVVFLATVAVTSALPSRVVTCSNNRTAINQAVSTFK